MEQQVGKKHVDGAFTYDDAVEHTGHGGYNYILLATCSLISFAVAMDMFGFSVTVAAARCDLDLTIFTSGLLNSTPLAGTVIFSFPWGYFADRRGRRAALLLSTGAGFVFSALCALAPNWQTMFVLKLVGCSFSTASYTLTFTYLGEGTGSSRRRRYMFIMNSLNLAAELVFYTLSYLILPLEFFIPIPWLAITFRPWRAYTLIVATPLGIGTLMLLLLYESPKLLATTGRTKEALRVLEKIYERNGGKGEYKVKYLKVEGEEVLSEKSFWQALVQQTVLVFKPPNLWRILQLYYLIGICCAINNIYLMWYPMMVNLFFNSFGSGEMTNQTQSFCDRIVANISSNEVSDSYICDDTISPNTLYSGMLLGLTFTTISLAASVVASYRRVILIASYFISGVCLILTNYLTEPVSNMIVFTLVQITAVGIGSVATYFVDLFPTAYRGLVTSMSTMFMRLMSLIGVNVIGSLMVSHCGLSFYLSAFYVASGIVVALFLPPDARKYK